MQIFKKKKRLVTHDGSFHADDLFATAVIIILNDNDVSIVRSRDPQIIEGADYVYDVGGVYDEAKNRFDHHQKEGAGKRENGIPYASFGLIWKAYGEKICESKEVADIIDKRLVQSIDAIDNGIDITKPIYEGVSPFGVSGIFLNNLPTWRENDVDINKIFIEQSKEVAKFLSREIEVVKAFVEGRNILLKDYETAQDKRIIITETNFPRYLYQETLSSLVEPLYVVMPSGHNYWKIEAISKSPTLMESRKPFPESWRGFSDDDARLREVTGIEDMRFCHRSGYLAGTYSKESAIKLAEKALLA